MIARKLAVLTAILVMGSIGLRLVRAEPELAQQIPHTPLLIAIRHGQDWTGDIWAWGGSDLIPRTRGGLCFAPVISPAGDAFVYLQIPPDYAKQTTSSEDKPAPRDLYLTSLTSGRTLAIATQPKDASFAGRQARYTLRSEPTWSSDGKLLAWTELEFGQAAESILQDEQLVLYDVNTKTAHTLISHLPTHRIVGDFPALSEVSLGPGGLIAVRVHVSQDIDSSGQDWLYFYDGTGKQLARRDKLEAVEANYEYSQLIWLSGMEKPYLSCVVCVTKIDPSTGTADALNGTPELYSALAPDKLSLYLGADSGDESNVTWIIALNGKPVSKFDSVRIANVRDAAIAPDGMQIAAATYVGQGTTAGVFIYQAQNQRMVKVRVDVIGVSWGPIAWRVRVQPAQ